MNKTTFSPWAARSPDFFRKPAALLHRLLRGSLLLAVILNVALGLCRGENLAVTFSPATQVANPGDVVTFQGTIRNNGAVTLYLNANAIAWSLRTFPILPTTFDLLADDGPFATGVPVKLAPGEEWTGNLFRVTVGIDAPATNYDGTLAVLGGPGVLPFDVQGTGIFHLTVTGTLPGAEPAAPGSLTATASGSNVALAWVDLAGNEEGFSIEQATDGGAYSVIALVGGDRQHYLVGGLNHAHVYFFRIRAFNGFNTLTYSAFSGAAAAQVNEIAEATSAAGAIVNFAATGVTGLSYSSNSGTTFALGTTPVTFSATDLDSNTAGGAFSVTVRDTTAPLVAAHADVFVEATSATGAIATYAPGSATDAVTANPVITYSKNSGTLFPLGGTFVTFRATDVANNTGPGVFFNVVVEDTTAPMVAAHANVTVEATSAAGAIVNYAPGGATDAVTASPAIAYSQNSGTVFPIGVTTVTITALDAANNMGNGTFTVTVEDTTAPTVAAHANVTAEATSAAGAIVTYAPGSAIDAVTASPAIAYSQNSGTVFPIGVTTVTITALDAANNMGSGTFTVTMEDTTAPMVAAHANVTVEATSPSGAIVNYSPAMATDAVGVQSLTYSKNSGTNFPIGTTTVTATATDGANNSGMASFTVTVTPLTVIQSWRFAHYGTIENTGIAADTADPYNTGIPNLLAFAFFEANQDPAQAAISQLPQVQMAGGNLFFSFTEPAGVGGITYGADWKLTLDAGTWEAIPDTGTGTQHIFSVPLDSNPQMFMRLRVTSP